MIAVRARNSQLEIIILISVPFVPSAAWDGVFCTFMNSAWADLRVKSLLSYTQIKARDQGQNMLY